MKVYKDIAEFTKLSNAVVTTGTYDGVHIGHRKILQTLVNVAKENKGETVVITFWPHPRKIIGDKNQQEIKYLSTLDEKIDLLQQCDIDHLVVVPFTTAFSQLNANAYVENFLVNTFHPHTIVVGHDHRFGKERSGDFMLLEQKATAFNFIVKEIDAYIISHNNQP